MFHKNAAAALLALTMASATTVPAEAQRAGIRNPTLNSVNQPIVQRTDYVIDLTSGGSGLPSRELGRLEGWLVTLQLGYGDRLYLDTGSYDDPVARRQVTELAARYGMFLNEGAPITAGSGQAGSVRVIVSRSAAFVPGCPNWADAADIGGRISTSTNYGCAVNSNFAAMIADPNDLVLGQNGSSGLDAAAANKAIDAYRKQRPSGASGQVQAEATGKN